LGHLWPHVAVVADMAVGIKRRGATIVARLLERQARFILLGRSMPAASYEQGSKWR
jgi:hypothetical protein